MKGACAFLLCLLCVTVSARGHGGRVPNRLKEFLRAGRAEASTSHIYEDVSSSEDYSPVYVGIHDGLKDADKISSLPGQPRVNFSQYSGYITVDPIAGRALFYYFTEAERSSEKPLVLWLNGDMGNDSLKNLRNLRIYFKESLLTVGPGCSSLGSGAMTELGPFRVNPDGKTVWHNKNAWNNAANVIFLESPAGVGFSYSNRSSDYMTGDEQTAADTYTFLVNWLERFPEYKNREFYITGESYAGHYVPQLAALILQNNGITNQTHINLKGIAIGNAYIDSGDNSRGVYDYYWTHALISDEIHRGIVDNCNFSSSDSTGKCTEYTDKADDAIGDIFAYNIYAPLCASPSEDSMLDTSSEDRPSISGFDPCTDDYVHAYLNRAEVQKALHANSTGIHGPWNSCSDVVYYNPKDMKATVIPTIKGLMGSGIRVWLFSGDTDSVVPITATRYSLAKIGAPVKTPWYPWYTQGEVGGYVEEYENITLVTVRGAGHFVPSYQPQPALVLFSFFLQGKLPPNDG